MRILHATRKSKSEIKEKIMQYARMYGKNKPFIFPYSQNNYKRAYKAEYEEITGFLGTKSHTLIHEAIMELIKEGRLKRINQSGIYKYFIPGKPLSEIPELFQDVDISYLNNSLKT